MLKGVCIVGVQKKQRMLSSKTMNNPSVQIHKRVCIVGAQVTKETPPGALCQTNSDPARAMQHLRFPQCKQCKTRQKSVNWIFIYSLRPTTWQSPVTSIPRSFKPSMSQAPSRVKGDRFWGEAEAWAWASLMAVTT